MPARLLSLVPEQVKLKMMQGTDAVIEFQLLKIDQTPVDITNHAVKFTAKTDFGGTTTIATKTNAAGSHSESASGKTTFVITRTDSATPTPADEVTWYYEVRLVESNGQESVYTYGELALVPAVGTS